ncbi:MAG: DUF1320 domain-containing protein [Maricaulaceae bacterium]|nr:DUF1320 domain-containing protein [Maricaulaceae bacterium]
MAYATAADLIERWTEAELRQLAPPPSPPGDGDPVYDADRVARMIADASAELDSWLAVRFSVPIAEPPPQLVAAACDLAREKLDRTGRAHVLEAGKRAREWAKAVAAGKATLGGGPDGDESALPPGEKTVLSDAPRRIFDDAGLEGFTS